MEYTVNLEKPYNQFTYLTAHNAYANRNQCFIYIQQDLSISDQLKMGVRALMLDISTYNGKIYLCHKFCNVPHLKMAFLGGKSLEQVLTSEIKPFFPTLVAERSKFPPIITIFFESSTKDSHLIQDAFNNSGVQDHIYCPSKDNNPPWPTLQELLHDEKYLVVFSEQKKSDDKLPRIWQFNVENRYGNQSLRYQTWAEPRKKSQKVDEKPSPLTDTNRMLLVNHFADTTWRPGLKKSYGTFNDEDERFRAILRQDAYTNNYSFLWWHITDIVEQTGRLPNFIAVDFVDRGYSGGYNAHLDENGVECVTEISGPLRIAMECSNINSSDDPARQALTWPISPPAVTMPKPTSLAGHQPTIAAIPNDNRFVMCFEKRWIAVAKPTLQFIVGTLTGPDDKIKWSHKHNIGAGHSPSIALYQDTQTGHNYVVLVYRQIGNAPNHRNDSLISRVGKLNADGSKPPVEWGDPISFASGYLHPCVGVFDDTTVLAVFQNRDQVNPLLLYQSGHLDIQNLRIDWSQHAITSDNSLKHIIYDKGENPTIATKMHNGQRIVIEVHDGAGRGEDHVWYRIGEIVPVVGGNNDYRIKWVHCGLCRDDNLKRGPQCQADDGNTFSFNKGLAYHIGSRPALAIDDTFRIIETHHFQNDLWMQVGLLKHFGVRADDIVEPLADYQYLQWGLSRPHCKHRLLKPPLARTHPALALVGKDNPFILEIHEIWRGTYRSFQYTLSPLPK